MVREALGAPVSVDAHPKHAVSLGAAQVLTSAAASASGTVVGPTAPVRAAAPATATSSSGGTAPPRRPAARDSGPTGPLPAPAPAAPADRGGGNRAKKKLPVGVIVAVVVFLLAVAGGAVALASGGGGDDDGGATGTTAVAGPDTKCTSESGRCARLTDVKLDGDTYLATYTVKGFEPIIYDQATGKGNPEDHHVHFFFDTVGADHAGTNTAAPQGPWQVWDRDSGQGQLRFDAFTTANQAQNGGEGATKLCILVADAVHGVEQGTGNCLPLPTS
jgi:hypothetical protein